MRRDPAALRHLPIMDLYGAFGCDFRDGWYELMRDMCAEIVKAYTDCGLEVDFEPVQIKEKYGALRIYYSASCEMSETVQKILDGYEEKSMTVCEVCGQPGALRSNLPHWQTLCDTHYQNVANVKPGEILKQALKNLRQMIDDEKNG